MIQTSAVGKRIAGYPAYIVFNDGTILSEFSHKFLKPSKAKNGYLTVELHNSNGMKRKTIHRLVAEAFISNPNNLPQINHIDENKENNSVDNLEWCTAKYNMNYGSGAKNRHKSIDYSKPFYKSLALANSLNRRRPVKMMQKDGTSAFFNSAAEAFRATGINKSHITECCNGKRKTAGGYAWQYEKEE